MALRFAILGLLSGCELSGYELSRRFETDPTYFWQARSQQIYPELARLEQDGLVRGRLVEQSVRPDKRVYAITPEGRVALAKWTTTPSPPTLVKDEFLVKVRCYGSAATEAAIRALQEQRRAHEQRLAERLEAASALSAGDPSGLDEQELGALLALRAGISLDEAFLAWCAEAEDLLRSRGHDTPGEASPRATAAR